VQSKVAVLFLAAIFAGAMNLNTALHTVFELRAVYYREQASRSYPSWVYSLSFGVIEIPYTVATTIPFTLIMYWMVGYRNEVDAFFNFWLTVAALSVALNSFGHLLGAVAPNVAVGGIFGGLFITLFSLFPGFYIVRLPRRAHVSCAPVSVLTLPLTIVASSRYHVFAVVQPYNSIPKGWIWLYWANPVSHAFRGMGRYGHGCIH
jgi:ABC-type multidrug transport system permease subunit